MLHGWGVDAEVCALICPLDSLILMEHGVIRFLTFFSRIDIHWLCALLRQFKQDLEVRVILLSAMDMDLNFGWTYRGCLSHGTDNSCLQMI